MPFVIQYQDGTYLHRAAVSRVRRQVGDLNEATTWGNSGHAKNAAREAYQHGKLPRTYRVVEVALEVYICDDTEGANPGPWITVGK